VRIFEPFFSTKDHGKGIGMVLAAVYGTIKNHKGAISVTSALGHGSSFDIFLPLHSTEDRLELDAKLNMRNALGKTHKKTATILFVDDEGRICDASVIMVEKLGYSVSVCRDGKEAVEYYRKKWQVIDLVIVDMVMPVMDGKQAFVAMRKINPDIIALVSSGYSIDGEAQKIIKEGAKGFIQKPYSKRELSEKILELLLT
jgi:CheY-like chemotaxis protein